MSRPLLSTFELDTPAPTRDDMIKVIGDCDFDYFASHFQQIIDKSRQLVPMKLNRFQQEVFKKLLPLVDPKTRINRSRTAIFVKSRRVGASTGMIAFVNFLLSYVEGIENLNVLHLFQDAGAASKLYNTKVKDIVTGVHPDLMPTIYKESANSSIVLNYDNILGVRRHNFYELASANTSSLRGSDFHVAILDEAASYRHPEDVEAAVAPMMPPHGFSLTVFASTFDDKMGPWYKEKIITAMEHPDEYELIFVPWFASYPEILTGYPLAAVELTEYDQKVIMPAMAEYGLPQEAWGDALVWFHRMSATMSEANMRKEFPTTLEEVLAIGENKRYFNEESLLKQEQNLIPGTPYRLLTDPLAQKPVLSKEEASPFCIFRQPIYGHKYMITVDPITANNEDTDLFSAIVWDTQNNEQVATFRGAEMTTEDYAEYIVGIAKIYNRAVICVEKNVAEGFNACVRAHNYYNVFYENQQARARRDPGIRTTVSSKPAMLDKLSLLLDTGRIIIRDRNTLDQLRTFEKRVKTRTDGSTSVTASAPKGKRDDDVAACWIYAGTLDQRALTGKNKQGFAIL